jgi:hypothetical protein
MRQLSVDFDDSYAIGGESLTPADMGLSRADMVIPTPQRGYSFEYDETNEKLKALDTVPILVEEEVVTVAAHAGQLAYKPLYIVAVQATTATNAGAYNVIPTGETPLTKQVAVDFTTGALAFLSTDVVTVAKITYVPQQTSGPLAAATLVVDEAVTAAAAKTALANRAIAVQYVWDDTDSIIDALEPVGEAPSATHTAVIDITDTAATKIDSHADDEGNTLKVTYLKYASFPAGAAIDDADTSLTSEAYDFNGTANYRALVIPGLGTQVVGEETGAGNEIATWEHTMSGTAANTVATWDPAKNYLLTNNTNAMVTLAMPFFVLDPASMQARIGEVANGRDLSALTSVRVMAMGI